MLTHRRQKSKECLITSLSILSGIPVEKIKKDFKKAWGVGWRKVYFKSNSDFTLAAKWLMQYAGVRWSERMHERASIGTYKFKRPLKFPTAGKYLLIVRNPDDKSHAIAFEDGIIYDPAEYGPMTFDEWKEKLKEWKLLGMFEYTGKRKIW